MEESMTKMEESIDKKMAEIATPKGENDEAQPDEIANAEEDDYSEDLFVFHYSFFSSVNKVLSDIVILFKNYCVDI